MNHPYPATTIAPYPVTGLILAGGQSRRMGSNKALLPLHGRPLIARAIERLQVQVAQLVISTNVPLPVDRTLTQVADSLTDVGPLGGILAGMQWLQQHSAHEWLLSVAVDTPFFPHDVCHQLWQARQPGEVIVSACSGGKIHPTFSLWHISLAGDLARYLQTEQQRRVLGFIARHLHRQVDFRIGDADPFCNLNTPEDWQSCQS